MHYARYTPEYLQATLAAAECLHSYAADPMLGDVDKWDFLGNLEAEIAEMRLELTRRANPPERIAIRVEMEVA